MLNLTPEFSFPSPLTSGLFIPQSLRSSSIDDLLSKPDLKLEELLEDPDFGFELKNGNPKLHDYFSRNTDKIRQLIEYITVIPPDMNDDKRAYKYPLAANEAFDADINSIMCAFFPNTRSPGSSLYGSPQRRLNDTFESYDLSPGSSARVGLDVSQGHLSSQGSDKGQPKGLLSHLFAFLQQKTELNSVLAGYFNNTFKKLWKRNSKAVVEFVYSEERILLNILDHVYEHSITEVVAMCMTYEHYLFDDKKPEYHDIKLKVIEKLVSKVATCTNADDIAHIGEILNECLNKSETMADGREVKAKIHSKDTVDRLLKVLKETTPNSIIVNTCHILFGIIEFYNKKRVTPTSLPGSPAKEFFSFKMDMGSDFMSDAICMNLDSIARLLASDTMNRGSIMNSFAQTIKPLGLGKLKVVDLIERMIRVENRMVYTKINETGILRTLTDLFTKYVWNNMLHTVYERLISTVLDKKDNVLLDALFEKAGFLRMLVRELKEDQFELPTHHKKVKKGHMGFVVKMANEVNRIATFDKAIDSIVCRELEWNAVVGGALKNKNDLYNKEIGGQHPRALYAELGILPEQVQQQDDAPSPHPGNFGKRDSLTFYSHIVEQQQKSSEDSSPEPKPQAGSFLNLSSQEPMSPISSFNNNAGFTPKFDPLYSNIGNSPMVRTDISGFSALIAGKNDSNEAPLTFGSLSSTVTAQPLPVTTQPLPVTVQPLPTPESQANQFRLSVQEVHKNEAQTVKTFEQRSNSVNFSTPSDLFNPDLRPPKMNIVAPLRHSSTIEVNSPQKPWDFEDILGAKKSEDFLTVPDKSKSANVSPNLTAAPSLNNSMVDLRPNIKVQLKMNKDTALNGNKILEMLTKYRGPSTTANVEYTYSGHDFSEAENLVEDEGPVIGYGSAKQNSMGFYSYIGRDGASGRGYY